MKKSAYINPRLYFLLGFTIFTFITGHFVEIFILAGKIILFIIVLLIFIDILLLFRTSNGLKAKRLTAEKFSNGDENPVNITIENCYGFPVILKIIDELPFQFQWRNFKIILKLNSNTSHTVSYTLRPVERGEYHFGSLNIYLSSPISLIYRRYCFEQGIVIPVYPSYIKMRNYEILAISNRLTELGIKKNRRIGHTLEFDHIRKYVIGDDYRSINWKATARKTNLMTNQYQDEKSQQIYSVIDMGRVMKMPFEGMSLLDYAINASLVISKIALHKYDKAGIITFSDKIEAMLAADRKNIQMNKILRLLYNQKTLFPESNYEKLFATLALRVKQRSLVILYSNFETLSALKRQLPYIRKLAIKHLLIIIFFENTELKELLNKSILTTEDIYQKTIAEKFSHEKRQIIKELDQYGIHSILTPPSELTLNVINNYLEFKARGLI